MKTYQDKTNQLMMELSKVTADYNNLRKDMISYNQVKVEREERILKQQETLDRLQGEYDELDIRHNTLGDECAAALATALRIAVRP